MINEIEEAYRKFFGTGWTVTSTPSKYDAFEAGFKAAMDLRAKNAYKEGFSLSIDPEKETIPLIIPELPENLIENVLPFQEREVEE